MFFQDWRCLLIGWNLGDKNSILKILINNSQILEATIIIKELIVTSPFADHPK